MNYLLDQPTKLRAPQCEPIPGRESEMVPNEAGGFAFRADQFVRMERFLILGTEGGSYYVSERDVTRENVANTRACIEADPLRAIRLIADISDSGRAAKNDPALYALALAASSDRTETRKLALGELSTVARTGAHLLTFCAFANSMRGWGSALRFAVKMWYYRKSVDGSLAYQVAKYQQRNGWSHRDLLRLAHPTPSREGDVFGWVCGKPAEHPAKDPPLLAAVGEAKQASEKRTVELILEAGLTREMIATRHLKSAAVWDALLHQMPLHATIRNLGVMGSVGLLLPLSDAAGVIARRLTEENIQRSRLHPVTILSALATYNSGHGVKGSLSWPVVPSIKDAIENAFYLSFSNVTPIGKNVCIGVDVSGSMGEGTVAGAPGITPAMGAAAMAMLVARKEESYFIGGFADEFRDLGIAKSTSLVDAMAKVRDRNFGATDCAVAIRHALVSKMPVDLFVIVTDGATWAGNEHTCQILEAFRRRSGCDSKLVVVNMVANKTSIADPADSGSLDVIGFDASVHPVIADFARGAL